MKALNQKGQAPLETAAAFVLMVLFVGAIIKVWFWANNQIIERQVLYNQGRVAAGAPLDYYQLQWPLKKGGADYRPRALSTTDMFLAH